jgi:hypothetical protein
LQDLLNNQDKELFLNRKVRGPGPWAMDSSRVARSTMDRWQHGQKGTRARWRACWSLASGHSRARGLTGEGAKERGARGTHLGPHQSSGGGVAARRQRRSGSGGETQRWRCLSWEGGENERGRCDEWKRGSPPFIGAVRQ